MLSKIPLVVALSLALAMPAFPQAAETQQRFGEAIDVSIVNIDFVVTDRSGKPVHGLTAADFEVRDDGKPQAITNFAEYSTAGASGSASVEGPQGTATPAPAKTQTPNDRRTVVVFVERFRIPPKDTDRFFEEIKSLLREVIRPGDAAAIVSWNYVMKVRQDFTSNHAALDKALDTIKTEMARVEVDQETILLQNAFLQDLMEEASIQQEQTPVASASFSGAAGARQALVDIRRKSNALNTLINTMAGTPGKKILIMGTDRFSQYAGAEYFSGDMSPELRTEFDTYEIRKEVADNANAAGVTIYAIYPRGAGQVVFANVEEQQRRDIMVVGPPGQTTTVRRDNDRFMQDAQKLGRSGLAVMNETAAIDELAKQTGGVAAWGKTDIIRLVEAVRSDIGSYYSLAFRSTASGSKAHKIAVVPKNGSYNVRARREYVPKSDSMRMADRVRSSMYSKVERSKVAFDVETGKVRRNKRKFHIPVKVRIPMSSLTTLPGQPGQFSVFAAAGGLLGALSNVVEKSQSFTIKAGEAERANASVITYDLEIVADGRADRISIGVFDETSKEWGIVTVKLGDLTKKSGP